MFSLKMRYTRRRLIRLERLAADTFFRPGQGIFPHCDGPVYYPKDALARAVAVPLIWPWVIGFGSGVFQESQSLLGKALKSTRKSSMHYLYISYSIARGWSLGIYSMLFAIGNTSPNSSEWFMRTFTNGPSCESENSRFWTQLIGGWIWLSCKVVGLLVIRLTYLVGLVERNVTTSWQVQFKRSTATDERSLTPEHIVWFWCSLDKMQHESCYVYSKKGYVAFLHMQNRQA